MAAGGTRRHPRRLRYTDFSLPLSRLENRNFIARWDQGEGTRAVGEEKGSEFQSMHFACVPRSTRNSRAREHEGREIHRYIDA